MVIYPIREDLFIEAYQFKLVVFASDVRRAGNMTSAMRSVSRQSF